MKNSSLIRFRSLHYLGYYDDNACPGSAKNKTHQTNNLYRRRLEAKEKEKAWYLRWRARRWFVDTSRWDCWQPWWRRRCGRPRRTTVQTDTTYTNADRYAWWVTWWRTVSHLWSRGRGFDSQLLLSITNLDYYLDGWLFCRYTCIYANHLDI